MKKIKLTKGQYAIIDNEDFKKVNQFKWQANYHNYDYRALSDIKINNKFKKIYMHRLIMNPSKNMQIDHINHNSLDNRKCNLRIVTNQQNQMNRISGRNTTSKYKGVCFYKRDKNWQVEIKVNNKKKFLGRYKNEEKAAKIYNKAALKFFGKYVYLNKVYNVSK